MVSNQITIGGDVFMVSPLLGERSFLLQPKLMPVLTDVIALYAKLTQTYVDVVGEVDPEADVDPMTLLPKIQPALGEAGEIVERICAKLGPNLQEILRTLLQGATMNGKPLFTAQGNPFDVLMQGRTLDTWRLLTHALEVSYPDFFGRLRGFLGKTSRAGQSSGTSTTSPPGPASGS